jgi:hypothetical protein
VISVKTRWLAFATGCLVAIELLITFGARHAVVVSALLVSGAIVQSDFPRVGRILMWVGALWLSFWVFFAGFLMFGGREPATPLSVFDVCAAAAAVLALACDGAIVIEEIKIWRTSRGNRRAAQFSPQGS